METSKIKIIIALIVFLAGLFFTTQSKNNNKLIEGFENNNISSNCPNLLIQKDGGFYLYNTQKMEVPGVNPIKFDHLEEYTEFIEWLRGSGIRCPVLFAKQTYTTQGDKSFKICPSDDPSICGLPQSQFPQETKLINAGHNKGSMPAFDPDNQYIGEYTPLDKMFHEEERQQLSDNPIDNNWGGARYSQQSVDSGKYSGDTVSILENVNK